MIIVLVKYLCKPNLRDEFVKTLKTKGIDSISQNEEGNIRYDYSYPLDSENEVYLTEVWENEELLTKHTNAEHFKELASIKEKYVENVEIKRYETK